MNERQVRVKLKNDFEFFASRVLDIRPKNSKATENNIKTFILNSVQKHLDGIIENQLKCNERLKVIIVR